MRWFELTQAERWAGMVALVAVVLQALGAADALEYRRALLASEPWRLLSGHVVHINWPHVLVNGAALVIVARLFAPELDARRQAGVLLLSALAISAALALSQPGIGWYRGLSGVVHALFFAGATLWLLTARPRTARRLWLPACLVIGGWIKVILEQPLDARLPQADWLGAAVVPQAHLAGAVCGTLLALAFAVADARRRQQRGQQDELQPR
jgi:rhomboid family GlyGly-CTERM serine protease